MNDYITITITPESDRRASQHGWALGSRDALRTATAADIRATRPDVCAGWSDEDILTALSIGRNMGNRLEVSIPTAFTQATPDIPTAMWEAVGITDGGHRWLTHHSDRRDMYREHPDHAANLPSVREYRERVLAAMREIWPAMLADILPPWREFERRVKATTDVRRAQVLRLLPLVVSLHTPLGREPLPLVMDTGDWRCGDVSRYRPEAELRAALAEAAELVPGGVRTDAEVIRTALSHDAGLPEADIREIMDAAGIPLD